MDGSFVSTIILLSGRTLSGFPLFYAMVLLRTRTVVISVNQEHRSGSGTVLQRTSHSNIQRMDAVFDVWVPELRGNGHPTFDPRHHPERYRWSVDDYIDKDVPAIIRRVQEWYKEKKHGATPVFWVGKSMGGMIAYAYGQTKEGQENLKGVVTLGSPVVFGKTSVFLEFLTRVTPRNVSIPIRITELLERSGELTSHFRGMGVNLENVDPAVLQTYLQVGFSNVLSSKVLSQFSLFFKHMTFCRYPRYPWMYDTIGRIPGMKKMFTPYSYTENLHRFTAPLLVIAGGHG